MEANSESPELSACIWPWKNTVGAAVPAYISLTRAMVDTMKRWKLPFSDMLAVWWLFHRNQSALITGWPHGPVNGPYENRLCTARCLTEDESHAFYFAHKFNSSRIKRCPPGVVRRAGVLE